MDDRFDPQQLEKAKNLAASPQGRQLLSALMAANPELMQKASAALASNDYRQVASILAPLMQSEALQQLLRSGE